MSNPQLMKRSETIFNPFQVNLRTKRTVVILRLFRKREVIFGKSAVKYRAPCIDDRSIVFLFQKDVGMSSGKTYAEYTRTKFKRTRLWGPKQT